VVYDSIKTSFKDDCFDLAVRFMNILKTHQYEWLQKMEAIILEDLKVEVNED
jgi:hypothetical protein